MPTSYLLNAIAANMNRITTTFLSILLSFLFSLPLQAQKKLTLQEGDHVTIIGNALAERMNHFGFFETLLHNRFPDKKLVVRNIGYAGDVVNEDKNLRVKGYPDRKKWLSMLDTDVLIVMYGFNESFQGTEQLDRFQNHLEEFVEHVTDQTYNEKSPPRLALVSPIAFEDLNDPNLPDGSNQNQNLEAYSRAIQSVSEKYSLPFVNLFTATEKAYRADERNWTFNGIHLTEYGYKKLARILDRSLFGDRPSRSNANTEELRKAVNDKNEYWFDRYRVNDQNDIYGHRSKLSWDGISNREVLQRELEILDQMVANRDRKIWSITRDITYRVKDDNLPAPIDVPEKTRGDSIKRDSRYLGGRKAMKKMDVHDDLTVNLFASEETFPELINPVQMRVDPAGHLWVAAWEGYPNYEPPGKKRDELIVLKDTDGDGTADKRTIFADQLKNPTGFHFWKGGVIVSQPPYLVFLKDTNGDGKADRKRRMLSHISSADTHHAANSFLWGAGGKLYFQEGIFNRTQIETPYGPVRNKDSAVWRFDPETYRVERYSPFSFANPHGHDINRWNQGFVTDGTTGQTYHDTVISGFLPFPKHHPNAPTVLHDQKPVGGTRILSSSHFPEEVQGNYLMAIPQTPRALVQYDIQRDGASYRGMKLPPILTSEDPNFRPVDIVIGSDGAMYLADWQNRLIDHMQNHIRHPLRDDRHGRIYRITHRENDLSPRRDLTKKTIPELLNVLKHPTNHVRTRARIELSSRSDRRVSKALEKWMQERSREETNYEHHVLEGLWMHQWLHKPDVQLLKHVLEFDDSRARAAGVRLIQDWRHEISSPLDVLQTTINDPSPLVRLESVRVLSHFSADRARNIAKQARNHEMDDFLEYTLEKTVRAINSR